MKRTSKTKLTFRIWAAAFLLLGTGVSRASVSQDLPSSVVPVGDPTYAQLGQLEKAGLLPQDGSQAPLTRLQVAERIFLARQKMQEIVVAQADNIPPPPADIPITGPSSSASGSPAPSGGGAPAAAAPPKVFESQEDLARAEQTLNSLEGAYDYELKKVQGDVKSVTDSQANLQSAQYELWKRLLGITEYPTITWHGLGRAFGFSRQYFGDSQILSPAANPVTTPFAFLGPNYTPPANVNLLANASRAAVGFLDLDSMGSVDKEIRWSAMIRYLSAFESNTSVGIDSLSVRRANLEYNPPWLSLTLGDFDKSYTPLTMWNRDNLDLKYMPEMYGRQDDMQKYESFFNHEPDWPFRGLRVSTQLYWPDSQLLESFQLEGMVHLIRSGFNDNGSGGTYFGSGLFSDWIFGVQAKVKSTRFYLGGFSLQLGLDAYGLLLDEPPYSQLPNSPYSPFNPATWAHQYQTLSLEPSVDAGLGGDASLGAALEWAYTTYVDDQMDPNKNVGDYAMMGGPYLRLGHSTVTFNYLNVGPNYFAPLAQTRQDLLVPGASGLATSAAVPEFLTPPLRGQFFLTNLPRASAIFSFYDRTMDNVFPYGMATPNRQGFGLETDVKALDKEALHVPASVYLVQEISGNIVPNAGGTAFTSVDGLAGTRNFTYLNVGPSLNLAPFVGLKEDLEVGVNFRYEGTSDSTDNINMTSTWILGGVRVGLYSWWEAAASFGTQSFSGNEMGYGNSTLARYPYEYDNTDLGAYAPFSVSGSRQSWRISSTFKMDRNSALYLDYDMIVGTAVPYVGTNYTGNLNDQFFEGTYEVQF